MANGSIAGMLAQSGQFAGRAIGAPLQAFGQNLGQQIGGMLTQRRQAEEIKQAQQIVSQYTTAGAINPGMLSKKAQEAEAEGKDYLADVFRKGAELANTNLATGQNMAAYNELATRSGLSPEEASIGIRGLIAGQYKDPSSALKGAMDTQKLVGSKAQRENAVEQLRAEGLDDIADDVEKGLYTDSQVGQVLSTARQASAAAKQGQAALEGVVQAQGLEDTEFGKAVSEGKLRDVSPSIVSKLFTDAVNKREEDAFIESAKKLDRPEATEAAELLEKGVITITGAKNMIKDGGKVKIQTADMDQYVLEDGRVVWGGDITVNGVERRAYQDPNDPTQVSPLPPTAKKAVSSKDTKEGRVNITRTEMDLAGISLGSSEQYAKGLRKNPQAQGQARLFWAGEYLDLIREEGVSKEQAEARAREKTLARIKDGEFQQTEVKFTEAGIAPEGVDQAVWNKMSAEDRAAFEAAG